MERWDEASHLPRSLAAGYALHALRGARIRDGRDDDLLGLCAHFAAEVCEEAERQVKRVSWQEVSGVRRNGNRRAGICTTKDAVSSESAASERGWSEEGLNLPFGGSSRLR